MKDEGIQSIREKTKPFSPLFRFSLLGEFVSERKHHDPILFHDNNNKAIASSGNAIKVSTGKKFQQIFFLKLKFHPRKLLFHPRKLLFRYEKIRKDSLVGGIIRMPFNGEGA